MGFFGGGGKSGNHPEAYGVGDQDIGQGQGVAGLQGPAEALQAKGYLHGDHGGGEDAQGQGAKALAQVRAIQQMQPLGDQVDHEAGIGQEGEGVGLGKPLPPPDAAGKLIDMGHDRGPREAARWGSWGTAKGLMPEPPQTGQGISSRVS